MLNILRTRLFASAIFRILISSIQALKMIITLKFCTIHFIIRKLSTKFQKKDSGTKFFRFGK